MASHLTKILACCLLLTPSLAAQEREGSRRSVEGERGQARSGEGQGDREGGSGLQGFKPQTEREAALYQMIVELQREVAALRREIHPRDGDRGNREGEVSRNAGNSSRREGQAREGSSDSREGDGGPRVSDAEVAKYRKQFQTYDKNGDNRVSLEERLAMKNYEVKGERLFNEWLYHLSDDLNRDGGVSLEEFAASRTRKQAQRWHQVQLLSVSADQGVIRIEARGGEGATESGAQSIRVEPKAIIVVKGREAKLEGLTAGQPIYLFMSHDQQSAIGLSQR